MEAAALILLPAMFLMLGLGYLVLGRVSDNFFRKNLSARNDRAVFMAERYMVQTVLAKTELARRNRELAALTEELSFSAQELGRLNNMKSKFLSMVVHDVRTPLAAIRGFSQILSTKMPGQREKTQFANIISSTDQLNRLISDLTDLAMIEAGKLTMQLVPFDLRRVAAEILPGLRVVAANKNIALNYREPPAPVHVNGDCFRLGQVVMNLINNALKFTPGGGKIDVTIVVESVSAVVYVKDSGIGIHSSEIKKIFEKFYQAKYQQNEEQRKHGWGLGLSIAVEIVRAHKGEIAASSQGIGRGSTFYCRLPLC